MSEDETDHWEAIARQAAVPFLDGPPEHFEKPVTVLASPGWRGVEGDIWRATLGNRSVIVKRYHPDTSFYVDFDSAATAAQRAAECGVGPAVHASDSEHSILVMEDLSAPWRAGGLHDAYDTTVRRNVITAKKTFQEAASLSRQASIFDEIDKLYAIAQKETIHTHNDIQVFKSVIDDARAKIESQGIDLVPSHRDGNTANIMVGDNNEVRLVDFDLAANCDPFEEIGCFLQEYHESDADAREGFEEWYGHLDEGLYQRSMLYGLADDLRWGLIAAVMASRSPRKSLEYAKYASWRYLRLEMQAKRSDVAHRIRKAA